jgi:hypothetical protein
LAAAEIEHEFNSIGGGKVFFSISVLVIEARLMKRINLAETRQFCSLSLIRSSYSPCLLIFLEHRKLFRFDFQSKSSIPLLPWALQAQLLCAGVGEGFATRQCRKCHK